MRSTAQRSEPTTLILLRATRTRDPDAADRAWATLLDRYAPALLGFTRRRMGPRLARHLEPDEVIDQAWMRVHGRLARFTYRGQRSLYRWLCVEIRRVLWDAARALDRQRGAAQQREIPAEGLVEQPCRHLTTPSSQAARKDEVARILRDLAGLPRAYRVPLEAVYVHGRSRREVARALGIRLNTLNQRLVRGLRLWRETVCRPGSRAY